MRLFSFLAFFYYFFIIASFFSLTKGKAKLYESFGDTYLLSKRYFYLSPPCATYLRYLTLSYYIKVFSAAVAAVASCIKNS